jgi:hypothetical protein
MLVSVTRLKVRKWWNLFRFAKYSNASIKQAIRDQNCLGGATYVGPGLTFWTATLWTDEAAVKNYVRGGAHKDVMPWLPMGCSEAATSRYQSSQKKLPSLTEILEIVTGAPKFFWVNKPTADHEAKIIPQTAPWTTRVFKEPS